MELTGKLHGISRDMVTGQCLVTFSTDDVEQAVEQAAKLQGQKLNIKATKYRKARSLDANAYHWKLCYEIAHVLHNDADAIHYELMIRYGTPFENADGSQTIITVLPSVDLRKVGTYARKIGSGRTQGKEFDHYLLIKPSRLYDTAEMARLIDGTIEEAQAIGVETLPPEELARMMEALEEYEQKKKKQPDKGM